MKNIKFTIADIQIGVGDAEFKKGLALYEKGAVGKLSEDYIGVSAVVMGSQPYQVSVDDRSFDRGDCDCYIGGKGELCKHMIALAIAMVYHYRPEDTKQITQPLDTVVALGEVRAITDIELANFKAKIKDALSFIKGYTGPSARWFEYQAKLTKGSRLILLALSSLPVCETSVLLCIDTLKKLDRKILRGVDDSDGTVGDTLIQIVGLLNLFVSFDPTLRSFIAKKLPKGEVFDWEVGFKTFD